MRSPFFSEFESIAGRVPASVWQQLQGSRIFLTGATGWFGKNLLETIVHANAHLNTRIQVTLLTRDPKRFAINTSHLSRAPGITLHAGDVRDFRFPVGEHSHILHAATTSAQETHAGETGLAKFDTLVDGTRRVLEFAASCSAKHLLFTSSGVAGAASINGSPVREDDAGAPPTNDPITALGQGKRAAEFLCSYFGALHGCHTTIARCFSFVGPFMPLDLHYAIGNFIRAALAGEQIIVEGDGTPLRSYLYTGDLVIWLLTLLTREGTPRIYNVGSDEVISIGDLANLVRDKLAPKSEVRIIGDSRLSIGNPVRNMYIPDITRAQRELNLNSWTPLARAITKTAANIASTRN